MSALRRRYGDGPLHLIAVIASFAIAGYAFVEIARNPNPLSFAIFFAGAIVCHDLIAFPIYSVLDRLAGRATGFVDPGRALNYVRIPAILAGFALVVWFPLILGLDSDAYRSATGTEPADYLGRWLALTSVLFVGSGLVYAVRRRSAPDRGPTTDRGDPRSPR